MALTGVQQTNTNTQQQSQQGTASGTWGFMNSSNGSINRNPTSEVLSKALEVFVAQYKEIGLPSDFNVSVVALDKSKQPLHLSGLAICVKQANTPIAFHVLMLEGSGERLEQLTTDVYNRKVTVDRLTSDVYDDDYRRIALQCVTEAFPGQEVRECSAQYMPRDFNLTDKVAVRNLAINCIIPCNVELNMVSGSAAVLNLRTFNGDSNLGVLTAFTDNDINDYAGNPVRAPIKVSMTATSKNNANKNQINSGESTVGVTNLSAMIDLAWAPVETVTNAWAPQVQAPTAKYQARAIVTNLEAGQFMTTEAMLLALNTVVSSLNDANGTSWFQYYQPKPKSGKGVDLRDIGAINIEAGIIPPTKGEKYPKRIDTKTSEFTNENLAQLITTAVRPGLSFALDASDCGSDTWNTEVFAYAAGAGGNADSRMGANAFIIKAADKLTGGLFSSIFPNGAPVMTGEVERIQLGYYINSAGQKRDIREFDHLAVLNLMGDKDPSVAYDWSQTFYNTSQPISVRLEARRKMLISLVGADITFTGYASRVTFTSVFLSALSEAIKSTNVQLTNKGSGIGFDYQSQRAIFGFATESAVKPGITSFSQSQGSFNGGFNQHMGQRNTARFH
jgi:hypothetical protein